MTDARLFTPDKQRAKAADVRRLLLRLENSGDDRGLGDEILNAIDAPHTIGDPLGNMDCAANLCAFLKHSHMDIIGSATTALRQRCREGWKLSTEITSADVARQMTITVLRVHLANLERAPA